MGRKSLASLVESKLPKTFFELTPKQVNRLKEISAVVLGIVATAGVATVSIAAPNALKLIKYLPNERYSRGYYDKDKRAKRKISRAIYYLKSQQYIRLMPSGDDFLMELTQKGKKKVQLINFQTLAFPQDKKWDKSWWFILADIPVEFRGQVDLFRKKLKNLGVMTFQKSVWAYPYNPKNELVFLAKYYGLERYVTTFRATELEVDDEKTLKSFFKSII